jgi:hypothetical protein
MLQGETKQENERILHEYIALVPETEWKSASCTRIVEFWASGKIPPAIPYSGCMCLFFLESELLNAWFLVLRQVGTLSVDVKELCKKTATREYIAGEWVLTCRYLVGMGFRAGGLSLFAESIEDTWG